METQANTTISWGGNVSFPWDLLYPQIQESTQTSHREAPAALLSVQQVPFVCVLLFPPLPEVCLLSADPPGSTSSLLHGTEFCPKAPTALAIYQLNCCLVLLCTCCRVLDLSVLKSGLKTITKKSSLKA